MRKYEDNFTLLGKRPREGISDYEPDPESRKEVQYTNESAQEGEIDVSQIDNFAQEGEPDDSQINNSAQGDEQIDHRDNIDYEILPNIIRLNNNEKLKDGEGKIINLEIHGQRNMNSYFKVKNVAKIYGIMNLQNIILNEKEHYREGTDYKLFRPKSVNGKLIMCLTYEGMIKLLKDNIRSSFIKWVHEISKNNKNTQEKDVDDDLGIPACIIKCYFNTILNPFPCVYLFRVGTVGNLRTSMQIDTKYRDDSGVYKFGRSGEIYRRTCEHIDTFKKIENTDLRLKYHVYMDPQYTSKGESDIRTFMNAHNMNFSYDTMEELVIIPKELMPLVKDQYEMIGKKYMGTNSELITKNKELENKLEIQQLNHNNETQQLSHKIEMQQETHTNALLKKELEIITMQIKTN